MYLKNRPGPFPKWHKPFVTYSFSNSSTELRNSSAVAFLVSSNLSIVRFSFILHLVYKVTVYIKAHLYRRFRVAHAIRDAGDDWSKFCTTVRAVLTSFHITTQGCYWYKAYATNLIVTFMYLKNRPGPILILYKGVGSPVVVRSLTILTNLWCVVTLVATAIACW